MRSVMLFVLLFSVSCVTLPTRNVEEVKHEHSTVGKREAIYKPLTKTNIPKDPRNIVIQQTRNVEVKTNLSLNSIDRKLNQLDKEINERILQKVKLQEWRVFVEIEVIKINKETPKSDSGVTGK